MIRGSFLKLWLIIFICFPTLALAASRGEIHKALEDMVELGTITEEQAYKAKFNIKQLGNEQIAKSIKDAQKIIQFKKSASGSMPYRGIASERN